LVTSQGGGRAIEVGAFVSGDRSWCIFAITLPMVYAIDRKNKGQNDPKLPSLSPRFELLLFETDLCDVQG